MPISNKLCTVFSNDDIAIEITEKSLQVVSKLVSGTDETSKNIRQEICNNELEEKRIRPILCYDQRYNRLKVPAIKILTKLALDNTTKDIVGDETIVNFINFLMGLFFSGHNHNESHLRKTAGKALALLAMDSTTYCAKIMNFNTGTFPSVVWQLSAMLFFDNRSYRTAAAQLLRQFCVNCHDDQTRERLASDKSILCEVLKVICNVDQEVNAEDSAEPQRNPSRGQAILQSCFPFIHTSSLASTRNQDAPRYLVDNGRNQRAIPATSSPAHRRNQNEGGGNTRQNLPRGSRNETEDGHNQGTAQKIPWILRFFSAAIYGDKHNKDIRGDNPAAAPIEPGRRKTLAAFLALAVEMCDKLIGSTGLDAAVAGLPLTEAEFVEALKEIIEMCNKTSVVLLKGRRPSVDYLVIIKSVTKFCTWVMRTKPGYVRYFQEKNVAQKLKDALEAMRGLELALLLTCKADENEMADYETLSSIVEDARTLMLSAT
ncbi:hypothetical protein BAE44_0014984 [Dichanthelium oligosanthes]|uniref:Uncharacterized protein n=1 Tax=Dichanthelium oligosanthes TaxID=888268 RepID=A0A1E5VFT1_9POAL|nr:hypothetical protein BAE44_0014984 [Dichanthelium oligosanthes]